MSVATLRFHFDFISPYAYLAWTKIHRIAERHAREVEPVPVLFAGLLNHHGTKGPAEVAAKRRYMLFDTHRKARALGVSFGPPKHHPFNPLLALRVVSVPMEAKVKRAVIDGVYAAAWSGRADDVESTETIARILRENELDSRRVMEEATSSEGKARVKAQTDRAIADGVFGVPTVLVDGEPFWGVDALPDLERYLREGTPTFDRATMEKWSSVTPSAVRPAAKT